VQASCHAPAPKFVPKLTWFWKIPGEELGHEFSGASGVLGFAAHAESRHAMPESALTVALHGRYL
jgi:hypothetical protein